ncbi:MAG: SDR family oxidoreductase [Pseudomonadota bacterium]
MSTPVLLSLGHGYSARALAARLIPRGWRVFATTRSPDKAAALAAEGAEPLIWDTVTGEGTPAVADAVRAATHVVTSIAPRGDGGEDTAAVADPALALIGDRLEARGRALAWVGYLSTVGVYGDRGGAWVDETSALAPASARGQARVAAEAAWRALWSGHGLPVHLFRLAGIYGPGRGPFSKVKAGTARRILKPGQVFSRIHVEDIATVLEASIAQPRPGAIYNVCDDLPAPPEDVLAHAAELLGLPAPPSVTFEEAEMGPMARSFYSECKRCSNLSLKRDLGVALAYPDYRAGLAAVLAAERQMA